MRVLLTGSSGWLGRFLAPQLRVAGHHVIGLDVASGAETHVIGSVADRAVVERTFSDYEIDAIIHAGALHKPDIGRVASQHFIDVNVTGTLNLLDAAIAAGHDRFVFTSTTSLVISKEIREEAGPAAIWLNEASGPLAPGSAPAVGSHSPMTPLTVRRKRASSRRSLRRQTLLVLSR